MKQQGRAAGLSRLAGTPTGRRLGDKKTGKDKVGQRGKAGEASVREALKALALEYGFFDWMRLPDARTAGGRIGRQTGDFLLFAPGMHGVIETKDLDHDFRLPRGRMIKDDKDKGTSNNSIERLWRRQEAGGLIFVLVHHTTTGAWRAVPLAYLHANQALPSWNLSGFTACASARQALKGLEASLQTQAESAPRAGFGGLPCR